MPDATLVGLEIFSKLLEDRAREREAEKTRGLQMLSLQAEERGNLLSAYQKEQDREDNLLEQLNQMSIKFVDIAGKEGADRLTQIQTDVEKKYPNMKTDLPNLVGMAKKNMAAQMLDLQSEIGRSVERKNMYRAKLADISDEPLWATPSALEQQQLLESKARMSMYQRQERRAANEPNRRDYDYDQALNTVKLAEDALNREIQRYRDEYGTVNYDDPKIKGLSDEYQNAKEWAEKLRIEKFKDIGINPVQKPKQKLSWVK